ncbi:hypothetical protein ABW19_dt0208386 [Dactylella cylindrospora]|nr:hypothetical protein ABW19_dt0208386 [Dactylella cylindrospora]
MPPTYAITIKNESNAIKYFSLVHSPPLRPGAQKSSYSSVVWMSSPPLPDESISEFSIPMDLYAIIGTVPGGIQPGNVINPSESRAVSLATTNSQGTALVVDAKEGDYEPFFNNDTEVTATSTLGAFRIATSDKFPFPNPQNIFIGLGGRNISSDSVSILAARLAEPNSTYHLFIRPVYYLVKTEDYLEPGTIIDMNEVGEYLTVDFTGSPNQVAKYVINNFGQIRPVESASNE